MNKQEFENDNFLLSRIDEDNQLLAIRATPVVKDNDFSKFVIEATENGTNTDVRIETIIEKFVGKLAEVIKSDNIEITTNEDGTEIILTAPEVINDETNSRHIIHTYSDESNEYQGISGNQYLRSLDLSIEKDTNYVVQLNLIIEEENNYKDFRISAVADSGNEIQLRETLYLYDVNNPNILTIEAKFKILANENSDVVRFFVNKQVDDNENFYIKKNSGWIAWFDGINTSNGNGAGTNGGNGTSSNNVVNQELRTYSALAEFSGIAEEQYLDGLDLLVNANTDCTLTLNLIIEEENAYKNFMISAVSENENNIQLREALYLPNSENPNQLMIETKYKIITDNDADIIKFYIDKQIDDNIYFYVQENSGWVAQFANKANSVVAPALKPLLLLETLPVNGAIDVAMNTQIIFTFDAKIEYVDNLNPAKLRVIDGITDTYLDTTIDNNKLIAMANLTAETGIWIELDENSVMRKNGETNEKIEINFQTTFI